MVDIILIVLLLLMLISAIDFSSQLPPTSPTWNSLEYFFFHVLGWSIESTTGICFGVLLIASLIVIGWGKYKGYTKRIPGQYQDLFLHEIQHNADVDQIENFQWFAKVTFVGATIAILVSWVIGKLFG